MSSVVAIVGAGQAGFQTASSLRQEGFAGRVLLIGDEPALPYQRPPLSKSYLAGDSGLDELWLRPEAFYEKQRIELVTGETVTGDRPAGPPAATGLGRRHRLRPDRAGHRGAVPPACRARRRARWRAAAAHLGRCRHPARRLGEVREVVVVGAGFIGLEFAAVARAAGVGVHIVEVTQHPMGRVVSAQTSRFFTGAHIGWGSTISLGTGGRAHRRRRRAGRPRSRLSDGRVLPADLVLVCIGVLPNAELARDAGLAVDNGIVVDEYLATGAPAISAIGDCANFPTRFAEGRVRLESVQNGVDQARSVAARIAGKPAPYDKVPWFWSDQAELKLQIAGITAGHDGCGRARRPGERQLFGVLLSRAPADRRRIGQPAGRPHRRPPAAGGRAAPHSRTRPPTRASI